MSGDAGDRAAGVAMLRQGCYRLLSRGFARPGADDRDGLLQAGVILDSLELDSFAFAPVIWRWLDRLAVVDWDALGREYVRLFDSAADGAMCGPAESQHLGSLLAGDAGAIAARLDAALRRYGGGADDERPPDHVGWQLELGARMSQREWMLRERGDDAASAAVLSDLHNLAVDLQRWLPGLQRGLSRHDRTGVFRSLGEAAMAFVTHEADLLGGVLRTEAAR